MSKASDRAYRYLRQAISKGEFLPGAQIREEEIASLCGVSRTPVRDALRRLEAEMFITRSDSQRSFVSEWSINDIEDVYMLRSLLESQAASLCAARASESVRDALNANNARMAEIVNAPVPQIDAFLECNNKFHSLIIQGAASERLAALLSRLLILPLIEKTAKHFNKRQLQRSLADHVEIASAIRSADSQWAGAVMIAHVRRAFHIYVEEVSTREPQGSVADPPRRVDCKAEQT